MICSINYIFLKSLPTDLSTVTNVVLKLAKRTKVVKQMLKKENYRGTASESRDEKVTNTLIGSDLYIIELSSLYQL